MKIENDHQLHRDIFKIIEEAEIEQEWIDSDTVNSFIAPSMIEIVRNEILDKVMESIKENYTYNEKSK